MKTTMKLIALILVLSMAACIFAGCGKGDADSDSAYVQEKGKLVVGITDFAPMDYMENGEWVGFDADMAKAFAASLGVDAEFVEIVWETKVMELNDKNIDCTGRMPC